MEEFREVYIENYGKVKVNRSGTCVIGKSGRPLSLHWRNDDGYVLCRLTWLDMANGGKKKRMNRLVHRLVAMAFVENPNGYLEVNHIDGNKENNIADNLEWCTRQYNVKHACETGLFGRRDGVHNGRHALDEDKVREIRNAFGSGETRYSIAKRYNIGWTTVDHVIKGHTWQNVG